MIIWQKLDGNNCSASSELRYLMSAVLSGWISQFTRTLCGTRSLADIQRNGGDTYGVTGDARPFAVDYAAMAWTGRADGSML